MVAVVRIYRAKVLPQSSSNVREGWFAVAGTKEGDLSQHSMLRGGLSLTNNIKNLIIYSLKLYILLHLMINLCKTYDFQVR